MEKETMLDYIQITSKMMRENVKQSQTLVEQLVELYLSDSYSSFTIVASGSSYNSAMVARPFMRKLLGVEVKVIPPFSFEHYEAPTDEHPFVLVVSQSGFSTNIISLLEKMKSKGMQTIGLTGNIQSDMKQYCDVIIDYGVGVETVGYVTKGVVALVLFLQLFSIEVARKKGAIQIKDCDDYSNEIMMSANSYDDLLKKTIDFYQYHEKSLLTMKNIFICGSGENFGTALEGALKIGETVKVPAVAYELEEYIHGPNLQLTPDYTVFFIDNNDEQSERMKIIFEATREITDNCYIISKFDYGVQGIVQPQNVSNDFSALSNLVVFQYLAYIITTKMRRWDEHPLFEKFDEKTMSKTENYKETKQ